MNVNFDLPLFQLRCNQILVLVKVLSHRLGVETSECSVESSFEDIENVLEVSDAVLGRHSFSHNFIRDTDLL